MKYSGIFTLVIFLVVSAGSAFGQESDEITATATIQTALAVDGIYNLQFGNVDQGVSTTVEPGTAGDGAGTAGQFNISTGGNDVDISFSLPGELTDGSESLDIEFGDNSASHNTTDDAQEATTFDPNSTLTNISGDESTDQLYIYLGGTVNPTAIQALGTYTSTITITVEESSI